MTTSPVSIVTGASRGLGKAIAGWLGKAGGGLVLVARNGDALEAAAEWVTRLGGDPLTVTGDVAAAETCRNIADAALDRFGRIDALVNNAGILAPIAPVAEADAADWTRNLGVNLMGPVMLTRCCLPALRRAGGRVVNISSGAANAPVSAWGAYCCAKAALTHFTAVLAAEEPEIMAAALRPGVVDTDMQALIRSDGPGRMPPDKVDYFTALKAEGRLEPPHIPARSAAWLALHGGMEWSGRFVEYDDPAIVQSSRAVFGERL